MLRNALIFLRSLRRIAGTQPVPKTARRLLSRRGQSFVELALILPVLLLIMLALVEVVFFISRYLDALDLSRQAVRFASVRDPFDTGSNQDLNCNTPNSFFFYYDVACIFSPPSISPTCTSCTGEQCDYCNGLNSYFDMNRATDDVLISVYTVDALRHISDTHPKVDLSRPAFSGVLASDLKTHYWALSRSDSDAANDDVWKKDCEGNEVRTLPHFTKDSVAASFDSDAPGLKGFVAVEVFYCYYQVLNVPVVTQLIPNPLRVHVYTIMPLPAAQPTKEAP